jgi:hypothetical protein
MNDKPKHPGGRPPIGRDERIAQVVQLHTLVGTPQPTLAKILGMATETMSKYYRDELDTAKAQANAQIAGRLYKKAMDGDTTAMIFWLKTQAKWRETIDISNDDGSLQQAPIQQAVLIALNKMQDIEDAEYVESR